KGVSGDLLQNVAILGVASKLLAPNRSDIFLYGMVYLIYDPAAPNWEIEQVRLSEDVFRLQLRMKRYHTGGSGESMMVMKRRAEQLQRELGYSGYQVLEFAEGIESETIAARRFGEGRIQLVGLLPVAKKQEVVHLKGEHGHDIVTVHAPEQGNIVIEPVQPPAQVQQKHEGRFPW
ncbi:MAG: hypothetical protein ACRDD3_12555, partial [Azovibrio sp.]